MDKVLWVYSRISNRLKVKLMKGEKSEMSEESHVLERGIFTRKAIPMPESVHENLTSIHTVWTIGLGLSEQLGV